MSSCSFPSPYYRKSMLLFTGQIPVTQSKQSLLIKWTLAAFSLVPQAVCHQGELQYCVDLKEYLLSSSVFERHEKV